MKSFTLRQALSACGGEYFGQMDILDKEISSITHDSRKVKKDSLFAAIVGERVDGHSFIPKCIEIGALCSLCEKTPSDNSPHILVKSTKQALIDIATAYRQTFDIPFIGITGSVGKTSTKEMLYAVLSQKFNVHKTQGNFNNDLGVPLTLFALEEEHQVAVIEMGISDFGEMTILSKIVRPDVCVLTNIGNCHLENLIDRDGVKKAKTEMFDYMNEDGIAVLCGDDDKLREVECVAGKAPLFFGFSEGCDFTAHSVSSDNAEKTDFVLQHGAAQMSATVNALGNHMVSNALAAAAVGNYFGMSDEEIVQGIAQYKAISGRQRILRTDKLTIIDDCYNANPNSMRASVETLAGFEGRRVAILGDMKELGKNEVELHREIGRFVAEKNLDLVISVGPLALNIYREARAHIDAEWFETIEEAKLELYEMLTIGDTVLVKASNSMKFSEIVEYIEEL